MVKAKLNQMPSIIVTYFERTLDATQNQALTLLGTETLDNVAEVLLPQSPASNKIYLIKKFNGPRRYQWSVYAIEQTPPSNTRCAEFKVLLEAPPASDPIEYLSQTINKGKGKSIQSLLWLGKLVEVDYGHQQVIGRSDGALTSNKRYTDTLQKGEMHKRRLAVVVSISKFGAIQVVPITSIDPGPQDKSAFEISRQTLAKLKFYGNSGKQSWAIASMIETVSPRRVLPPVSYFPRGSGRDPNYSVSLSSSEARSLKETLLHSIGVRDYFKTQDDLKVVRQEVKSLQPLVKEVEIWKTTVQGMKDEIKHLRLCKEVAEGWAHSMGLDLASEANVLESIYEQSAGDTPATA